jgi:hypothetical protein
MISYKEVSLVYFSTFEPIDLTPDSIMQRAGVPMLYDSASNQRLSCLYICPPVPGGHADTQRDRGNSSRLYKVNIWMWCYGRGRPQMVSIAEAERIRAERLSESRTRAAASQRGRCCSGGGARWQGSGLNTGL